MAGIIISTPPTTSLPPSNNPNNPVGLPGVTYSYALLNLPQTWGAKQTFPLGDISVQAADIVGLSPSATTDTTNANNLTSGTVPAARMPALTGDVTMGVGTTVTTLATGNAGNLNAGTLLAGRMPALTGDVTTIAGAVATTIANNAVTNAKAAQMAANTIKGNNTASTANAADLTIAQAALLLGVNVTTRAALKALDTTQITLAYLTEAGREGPFVWKTGNFATLVTADTQEGIYLKANAIATSAGAWVRVQSSVYDVKWFGAVGDNSTNETTAFQAAVNLAATNGATILISLGTYRCGAINSAGLKNYIVQGVSGQSQIVVIGKDSAQNWWDLCGADNIQFRDITIMHDGGTTIPKVLFPWIKTATGDGTSLEFDHVNIRAMTSVSICVAYGFGDVGQTAAKGGGFRISNSTWQQENNGAVVARTSAPSLCSILHLTGLNSIGITSANVTVSTGADRAWGASLNNFYAIDFATGYSGTGSTDHNTGVILETVTGFSWVGGACETMSDAFIIVWANCQGLQFDSIQFQPTDGNGLHNNCYFLCGGGLNSFITIINPFWSTPVAAFVDTMPSINSSATGGGLWYLTVLGNNVAGNASASGFIANTGGVGTFVATNPWLKACHVQTYTDITIRAGGSVDQYTFFQGPVTVIVPAGASDRSFKAPNASFIASVPRTLGGTSASIVDTDYSIIINAGGTFTLTLPSASVHSGRCLTIKSIGAQIINSALSNVCPLTTGTPGTAILTATLGKYASLQSDGTNWIIMMAN